MAYDIGPRISVAGEKEFNESIKQINSSLKVLGSELKATSSAFDQNSNNQEQLTAKGKTLSQQLDAQKSKLAQLQAQYNKQNAALSQLKTQMEQTTQEYGENSAEAIKASNAYNKQVGVVNNLKVAMNETTASMNKLENEISQNDKQVKKLDSSFEKLSRSAKGLSDKLMPISKAAGAAGAALIATVPATQELRMDLSYLSANADRVGISLKNQEKSFDQFNSMTGETDSSVEALSNLFEAGFDNNNLLKAVDGVSGAYAQFMDTLKIEGIADGIQETLATGKSVGQFGEYLDRAGIGAENFDKQLAKCTTSAEKQNLVLDALAKGGANESLESWQKNNKELSRYNSAVGAFQTAIAGVAESIIPLITPIIEGLTKLIELFVGLPQPVKTAIVGVVGAFALLAPALSVIGQMSLGIQAIKTAAPILGSVISKAGGVITMAIKAIGTAASGLFSLIMAHPVIAIITAIVAAVIFLYNKCEWFKNLVNGILEKIKGYWESFKNTVSNVVKSVVTFFTDLVGSIKRKATQIKDAIVDGFNAAISFITSLPKKAVKWGKDFIAGMIDGIKSKIGDMIDAVKGIGGKIKSFLHFSRPDEGPLREYETWMPDMMKGLGKGISQSEKYVMNPIEALASRMASGISEITNPKGRLAMSITSSANDTQPVIVQPVIYLGNKKLSAELTDQVIKKMGHDSRNIERSKGR